MRTLKIIMRGVDAMRVENPIVSLLGIAVIIAIFIFLIRTDPNRLKVWYKELLEDRQMVVGAVGCAAGLVLLMLFSALYGAGSGSTWF